MMKLEKQAFIIGFEDTIYTFKNYSTNNIVPCHEI